MSPSPRQLIERLNDRVVGTAFERGLDRAAGDPRDGILFFWNRGLGDVALALVPLFEQVRRRVPGARITVLTRGELEEAFRLTDVDDIRVIPDLPRQARISRESLRSACGLDPDRFGATFLDPDPTRWLHGARPQIAPLLRWDPAWDALADRMLPEAAGKTLIGAHVNSETAAFYSYVKDWPADRWRELFSRLADADGVHWLLFGRQPDPAFTLPQVTDLRGRTGLLEVLALVKNRCRALVGPDSGIVNTVHYLDAAFPIDIVTLWSDPRQGILQQRCPSPNPHLRHVPIVGRDEDVRNITVDDVERVLRTALKR